MSTEVGTIHVSHVSLLRPDLAVKSITGNLEDTEHDDAPIRTCLVNATCRVVVVLLMTLLSESQVS
jgi:hypothetical protein